MNRRKSLIYSSVFVLILAVLLGSTLSLRSCFSKSLSRTFFAADTVCTITIYDSNKEALDGAVELCNSLANKLNCKDDSSELGKLNKTKTCNNPSDELVEIIERGKYYSSLSGGVFDITVKPLTSLWNFKDETIPSNADISDALQKINYKNIEVNKNSISLKNNAEIDLGAIAKGYIANKINNFLTEKGVKSAVINLGGNVTVIGKKGNDNFNIGIKNPFKKGNIATINCSDISVVTSGIYERYFEKDGKTYHHLLSTETGCPIQNGLYSVTIISKSATTADALSTLCFLLGKEKSMELLKDFKNTEAVFVDENNKIHLTSGLKLNGNLIEIK